MTDATTSNLSRLVDGLLTLLPDLNFVTPGGLLVLPGARGIKGVRIELKEEQFLHLHSIVLRGPGANDPIRNVAVTASSAYQDRWPDRTRLFTPSNDHDKAFHTQRDKEPWIELGLPSEIDLDHIEVTNSRDNAARARRMAVYVLKRNQVWSCVYDACERHALARSLLEDARALDPIYREMDDELLELILHVCLGDYRAAEVALKGKRFDKYTVENVRHQMNVSILNARDLEWTMHGVRRSFRFWSKEEKLRYMRFCLDLVSDLEGLTENVCLGFGSALAAVRDGDLIPHDDDIDLIVGFERSEAPKLADALTLVEEHLSSLGYRVSGEHTSHRWIKKTGPHKIDVFVGLFEGDAISWYPGKRGALSRRMMFPPSRGTLVGQECPLPREPFVYLDRVYGENWRTPDRSFRHKWDRQAYQDLIS